MARHPGLPAAPAAMLPSTRAPHIIPTGNTSGRSLEHPPHLP